MLTTEKIRGRWRNPQKSIERSQQINNSDQKNKKKVSIELVGIIKIVKDNNNIYIIKISRNNKKSKNTLYWNWR